jgi:hypothetical protein
VGRRAADLQLAVGSLVTTGWDLSLADRRMAPDGLVPTLLLFFGLVGVPLLAAAGTANRPVARMGVACLLVAALVGPGAWSLATADVPHTGSNVRAGPPSGVLFPSGAAGGPAEVSTALTRLLRRDTDDWTWTAATVGRRAADLQLAVGAPVMPIGGFFGRDPAPTLARFQADVRSHRIHWYVPGLHGSGPATQIDGWVRRNAPAVQVGASIAYDLAGLASGHNEDET